MGKGNDPNCTSSGMAFLADAPGGQLAAHAAADQVLATLTAANDGVAPARHPSRRKPDWTEAEKAAWKADRDARVEEYTKMLEADLEDLVEHPEKITEWLSSLAEDRAWYYSYGNLTLARWSARSPRRADHGLNPFDVTRLGSKAYWAKQGYRIAKGEKGLEILRPVTRPVYRPVLDANGNEVKDSKGKTKTRKVGEAPIPGRFMISQTWDFRQLTDADGSPTVDPDTGEIRAMPSEPKPNADQAMRELTAVAENLGVKVYRGGVTNPTTGLERAINTALASEPNANGFYTEVSVAGQPHKAIALRAGLTVEEEARVLAHEIGHAVLHNGKLSHDSREDQQRKEVEAESVAYVISAYYGLATDRQPKYIAHWASGKTADHVKGAMGNVQKAARKVLYQVEEQRFAAAKADSDS